MTTCIHQVCQARPKGVAVCIVDPRRRKVLLGRERFGKYRGKYNLCAGSVEPEDGGCAVAAAQRELREEFKLALNWDRCFAPKMCRRPDALRFVMVGPTPVFVGLLPLEEVDHRLLTQRMQLAIKDDGLPGTHKEMEAVEWFSWGADDGSDADAAAAAWSRFARVALRKVGQRLRCLTPR